MERHDGHDLSTLLLFPLAFFEGKASIEITLRESRRRRQSREDTQEKGKR